MKKTIRTGEQVRVKVGPLCGAEGIVKTVHAGRRMCLVEVQQLNGFTFWTARHQLEYSMLSPDHIEDRL